MELADLFAREGLSEEDLSALVTWARGRAQSVVAALPEDSPLRAVLTGTAGQVSEGDLALTAAEVEEGAPTDLRQAVTAATAPHSAAEDDAESGLGGFARFGGMMRMNRPYPRRDSEDPVEERPTLARSFALAAEKEAEEPASPVPPPPGELTGMLPQAALGISAEESGGLVVGIPDEDSGDVPVARGASKSAAHLVTADPQVDAEPMSRTESVAVDLSKPMSADVPAPVLRQRSGKKKVVELGAPLTRGSKASATIIPRSGPSAQAKRPPPPPPPPGARRQAAEDSIEELSRIEMIEDLPPYLRDDD